MQFSEGMQWEFHPPTFWALCLNLLMLSLRLLAWTEGIVREDTVFFPWARETPGPGPSPVSGRGRGTAGGAAER